MKRHDNEDHINIDLDRVTLRLGDTEPIVIPRRKVSTGLRLLAWTYRLTGYPGMTAGRLRAFIKAVSRHHGWSLPESENGFPPDELVEHEAIPTSAVAAAQLKSIESRSHALSITPITSLSGSSAKT